MSTPPIIGRNLRPGMSPGGFTVPFSSKSYARGLAKRREIGNAEIKKRCDEALAKRGLADAEFSAMVEAQCSPAAKRIADLERENAELRADKARLDWLEKHGATPICSRAAIDAAMKSP